ncbi:MFS transporter [Pseudonocardia sp. WMMC193]|uniref:MFS transporter n=1 Tax=Pseudonocardia sp. WMMC193 TaxID=2911965 RepID=UPI001F023E11|nr:MFS transporter [Pseudonocardia sp. WMMC193]MCF7553554.1 MFS transporter [Pseudonocardia sp. WMMC193]
MSANHLPEEQPSGTIATTLDRAGFTRAQFWVLMLILAGMFFDTLEQNSVGAMGANLKLSLGITDTELTLINTFTVVGGLIGRLLGGWLADRYGRRTALSVNLLIYTLGGLISAVSWNYEVLLASRLIVGIGLGGEFTIGIAMLSEMVSTKRRGTLVAALNIGSGGVGNFVSYGLFFLLLGPLAAGLGGDDTVWRWTFLFLAAPALLVVFYRRLLPETPRYLLSKGRVAEANLSLTTLTSDSLRAPETPPTGPLTEADIPERQLKSSPAAVFARAVLPRTLTLGAASWMAFGAQVTLNFLMPTLLVARGYSISESLLFTMIMNIGSLLGAVAAALLAGRVGRRSAVGGAALLGCATAVLFAAFGHTTLWILVLGAVFQFFTMITNTTLAVWSPELFPTAVRASGTSIVNGIGNIAGAVMPFLAVALFGTWGLAGVFSMVAVMYALLVIASRFAPETRGRTLEQVNEHAPVPTPATV